MTADLTTPPAPMGELDPDVVADALGQVADDLHWSMPWVVVVLVVLTALLASTVRIVPRRTRLVVHRFGRTRRVAGPGVVLVLAGVETTDRVDVAPSCLEPLVAAERTRDGVSVRLTARARVQVVDPVRASAEAQRVGAAATRPPGPLAQYDEGTLMSWTAARTSDAIERDLARRIAAASLVDVRTGVGLASRAVSDKASRELAGTGVQVFSVEVVAVEVLRHGPPPPRFVEPDGWGDR